MRREKKKEKKKVFSHDKGMHHKAEGFIFKSALSVPGFIESPYLSGEKL